MQPQYKNVYIILLNWNGWEDTIECLESLQRIDYKNFKVIIVDNGSTNDSIEQIKKYLSSQAIQFQESYAKEALSADELSCGQSSEADYFLTKNFENLGFAGGNNVGIAFAEKQQADLVLLLNNDTTVEPNFLTNLVKEYNRGKYVALTPQIRYFDYPDLLWNCGGKLLWFGSKKYFFPQKPVSDLPKKDVMDISFVTGCALLYDYKKVGYLSEDFFFGEEDYEISLRMKRKNLKIGCVLNSIIYHKVSRSITASSENTFGKVYVHYLNRFVNIKKYNPYLKWKLLKAINLVYILPMVKIRHRFSFKQLVTLTSLLWQQSTKLNAVNKETFLSALNQKV